MNIFPRVTPVALASTSAGNLVLHAGKFGFIVQQESGDDRDLGIVLFDPVKKTFELNFDQTAMVLKVEGALVGALT